MGQDRFHGMDVVVHDELIGDRQKQRVSFGNRLILLELLNELVRFCSIIPTKDRPCRPAEEAKMIALLITVSKIGATPLVNQRKDTTTDRDSRLACMDSLLSGIAERSDLSGLLDVERLAGVIVFERRSLEIHAELRGPDRGRV